jgi:hypothetical protein
MICMILKISTEQDSVKNCEITWTKARIKDYSLRINSTDVFVIQYFLDI